MTIDIVIARIKKLLALSTSSNEHEAARAAGLAADLMRKYQLEEASLQVGDAADEKITSDNVIETFNRIPSWRGMVANGVCESLGLQCYRHGFLGQLRFIGRTSDCNAVRYLYGYICSEIDRLATVRWEEERHLTAERRNVWQNGFRLGAASVVQHRLITEKHASDAALRGDASNSRALMVLDKRALAVKTESQRIGLRAGAASRTSSYDGYGSGRSAGSGIGLGGRAVGAIGAGSRARITS